MPMLEKKYNILMDFANSVLQGLKCISGVANTKVKKKEKDGRCKKENIHRKKRTFFVCI